MIYYYPTAGGPDGRGGGNPLTVEWWRVGDDALSAPKEEGASGSDVAVGARGARDSYLK